MKELVNIIEDEFGVLFTKYELSVAGKKLVEKVEKETDYHFDKVVKGTIRFIPNEPEDDTSRWIKVSNDGFVTAYRCGIGIGCKPDTQQFYNVVSGMSQVRATMLGKRAYPATYKGWRVIIDN